MLNKFLNLIKNAAIKGRDMALANRPLGAILLTLLFVVLGVLDAYNAKYLVGNEDLISLEAWLGGLLAFWGVLLLARRTANQDKQLTIQINKEIDDRFIAAVTLLGSLESSARTGAVYSLYELAMESEKYRKQIAQILCSHIRSKTQEKEYQAEHKKRPSNEIQTAIDILFKDVNGVKGLYCQNFSQEREFPKANLSHAYLQGADFHYAKCQDVDFANANCQNVNFLFAYCQRADFNFARCWNADFCFSECQKTDFFHSELRRANFNNAGCQEANFTFARCHGADFSEAECHGADFSSAECQGADFSEAQCQGGNFEDTAFQAAKFKNTNFEGAYNKAKSAMPLEKRVGETTEVTTAVFSGPFSIEKMDLIDKNNPYYRYTWDFQMQEIQEKSKSESLSHDIPEGIIVGVLEDSEDIRWVIKMLKAQ